MNAAEAWMAIFGEEHGALLHVAALALKGVPPSVCDEAIRRLDAETTIGPMLNPTAYCIRNSYGSSRFDVAAEWKKMAQNLRPLLSHLHSLSKDATDGD